MKHKKLLYSLLPAVGLVALIGANSASAHGLFWNNLSTDEIVSRQQQMFEHQASILGLSVDEVKSAWSEGKTMQQLMQEKNISSDQVQAKIKTLREQQLKNQLQAMVSKGIITQAQADKRLQAMQTLESQKQNKFGMGMGRMHDFRL